MNEVSPPAPVSRSRAALYLLLVAAAALWVAVPGMDFRSIENHEHPRFARIAQNILWDGEWLLLHYGDTPYTNKPPLLMWLIAVLSKPFGHVNPWTARLPSALASCAGALATFGIGRRLANRHVGLIAALLLLSSWKWTWYAHSITTDMLLSGLIAVSLYCATRALLTTRQAGWWLVAGLTAGVASLAKGPLGLLIPLAVLFVAWWWIGPDRPRVRASAALAFLGFALAFLPWVLLLAERIDWAGMWDIVDRELVDRATSPTGQAKPLWYYMAKLPGDMLPWTLLWPALLLGCRPKCVAREQRSLVALGWVWAVVPIVLLSLSRGKASRFLLCAYPGWALLGAVLVDGVLRRWERGPLGWMDRWLVQRLLLVLAIGALCAPVVLLFAGRFSPHPDLVRVWGGVGCLLAGMGAYMFVTQRGAARLRTALGIVVVSMLWGHALHLRLLGVEDDATSPYKVAAREIYEVAAGRSIVCADSVDHRLRYCFRTAPADDLAQIVQRFEAGEPIAYVWRSRAWERNGAALAPWVAATREVTLPDRTVIVLLSRAESRTATAILPPDAAAEPPQMPSLRSILDSSPTP